jgi:hypothetical protein
MLIRSQDKEQLLNIDFVKTIGICERGKCFAIFIDSLYFIGNYSSREKIIKVLDMIQEAYGDAKLNEILLPDVCKSANESQRGKDNTLIAKTIRKDFMKKMIFQMPEDSEVEI